MLKPIAAIKNKTIEIKQNVCALKHRGAVKNLGLGNRKRISRDLIAVMLMMLPGLVYLFINNYMPMYGVTIAFREPDFSNFFGSAWNNFENFQFIFETADIGLYVRNTVLYNLVFLVINVTLPVILAILFCEIRGKISKRIYQTCIMLPFLMSWVVVSYITFAIFGNETGMINGILRSLGMETIDFYQEQVYWPFILTFFNTWKSIGYNFLFFYAAVLAINPSYYEAAKIDGASYMQQVWHITLPGIKTTIITMFILNVSKMFYSDFGLFYLVTNQGGHGALYEVTQTLDSYVYMLLKDPVIGGDIYGASALGILQAVLGFILVVSANAILRKVDPESSLF